MTYYNSKTVKAEHINEVRTQVEAALKEEGFGILTEIDIQATMKKKLDKAYPPYLILGACNPIFADKVLQAEPHIGVLLPCNVIIRETGSKQYEVSAMDPAAAMSAVENENIEPLASEVGEMLTRMLSKL
ncbi:DUF302 domain-containing protein [Belliella aquatica]|uniref:DUF302 domain-containing protein n=1 Tax=Belliella aquatica TaxID=1323734 RepID=A0ABQ1LWR5_9BACT|nr:DUF302 domain-containing protein [Belliella aquatica]MCH7405769.1 DUF302 domain-containing protein [Belliella aquatica]GGC30895.1 hypothetical protein GCM10010993_07250 [Belliella aquatica]